MNKISPLDLKVFLDLKKEELRIVRNIIKQYLPNKEVRVFGARINGTAKANSGLDLMIMSKIPLSVQQDKTISEAFEKSDLPFKVDVLDWSIASDRFKKVLNESGLLLLSTQVKS